MKHKALVLSVLGLIHLTNAQAAVIDFHIALGTGGGPWNTPQTTVEARVGDTVRIINDDSIDHLMHTFGRPCPHQQNISKPGDTYECEIATTVDPRIDTLYDHNFGIVSRFYLRATR